MDIRFYLDPETSQPHIYNHGVSEVEVANVQRFADEDLPGREGSRMALGKTSGGRYLRVIDVPDAHSDDLFVITAYPLVGKPLQAFKRRRKRRQ